VATDEREKFQVDSEQLLFPLEQISVEIQAVRIESASI
jgi:hypothetical protein